MNLKIIELDKITVPPTRHRTVFSKEETQELLHSIDEIGLLHPPTLHESEGKFDLIAGERRVQAVKLLAELGKPIRFAGVEIPVGSIPYVGLFDLSEMDRCEVEFQENEVRVNLTWQDKARAVAAIDSIRKQQDPGWRDSDTAMEMGLTPNSAPRSVRQNIILASNLDDPDIAKAKSAGEAYKILERKTESLFKEKLGEHFNLEGIQEDSEHTLRLGNCIELMQGMEEESVDHILTDPPYGIGAANFGMSTTWKHKYEDDFKDISKVLEDFCHESYRVANSEAHAYVFCAFQYFTQLAAWMSEAGWKVWPKPLIWAKDAGGIPDARHGPQYTYECILFANKGNREVNGLYPDVIQVPIVRGKEGAAEKPVDLFVNLLSRSAKPGEIVLDPFCGTGPIFPAANRLQLTAIGYDRNPEMIGIAQERLGEGLE